MRNLVIKSIVQSNINKYDNLTNILLPIKRARLVVVNCKPS
jgi:hypothetical protein